MMYILWPKNSEKNGPFRTVCKINALLQFTQKLKMAAKNGKTIVVENLAHYFADILRAKNLANIALSQTISDI